MSDSGTEDVVLTRVGKSRVYEITADGTYGWVGYVLNDASSNASLSGTDAFSDRYGGHYVFMQDRPPLLDTAPDQFASDFLKFLNTAQGQNFVGRAVAWLPGKTIPEKPASGSYDLYGVRFLKLPLSSNQVQNNYGASLGAQFEFHIGTTAVVDYDKTSGSLTVRVRVNNYNIIGFFDPGPPTRPGVTLVGQDGNSSQVAVPMTGERAGSILMATRIDLRNASNYFSIGFDYVVDTQNDKTDITYPILQTDNATCDAVGVIDPLDTLNTDVSTKDRDKGFFRTGLAFNDGQSLLSYLRTTEGLKVSMVASGGADSAQSPAAFAGGLVFNEALLVQSAFDKKKKAPRFTLTPVGDYALSVQGQDGGTTGQRMICGLFGSEWLEFATYDPNSKKVSDNDRLRFIDNKPAYVATFPFPNAELVDPDSGQKVDLLTNQYLTSWVNLIATVSSEAYYSAQPDGSPIYGGASKSPAVTLLQAGAPKMPLSQAPGFAFAMVPYAGFSTSPPSILVELESQIIAQSRKNEISEHTRGQLQRARATRLAAIATTDETTPDRATTPQGLLVDLAPDGITYQKVTLARSMQGTLPLDFALNDPTTDVMDALQTNQLFLVIVNGTPLFSDGASFQNVLDIVGWTFAANVGQGVQLTDYKNVMIMKFCNGSLDERVKNVNKWTRPNVFSLPPNTPAGSQTLAFTGLSNWLQEYFDTARTNALAAGGNGIYSNFVKIIDDPDWNGVLILAADLSVTSLPDQLEGIAAGIDFSRFIAHHFGASVSRVAMTKDRQGNETLDIDGISTLFGLIDYQDPAYEIARQQGAPADQPVPKTTENGYAFTVLQLQVLFAQSVLQSFQSHIQLNLDSFFSSTIQAVNFRGAAQGVKAVVLNGSAVKQGNTTTYVFVQDSPYLLTLDSNVVPRATIDQVQFNTLGISADDLVASRFLLWGHLDFALLEASGGGPFDLLSFGSDGDATTGTQGLAVSNLQIDMAFPQSKPGDVSFAFVPDNLNFDLADSRVRGTSLFKGLGLQLKQFISAPETKKPADYNFLPVVPADLALSGISGPWYGISFKIVMGSPGALVANAGFESDLLVAWSPSNSLASARNPALFVGLSLPGAAPSASVFSLQGVIKLSTGPINLIYQAPPGGKGSKFFSLQLTDIGMKVLGIAKLPPGATIQFFLFGDPQGNGSLGWYAAYRKDQTSSIEALPPAETRALPASSSSGQPEETAR